MCRLVLATAFEARATPSHRRAFPRDKAAGAREPPLRLCESGALQHERLPALDKGAGTRVVSVPADEQELCFSFRLVRRCVLIAYATLDDDAGRLATIMGILDFLMRIRPTSRPAGILILGLDNAGKTSILRQLSDEDVSHVTSTQGFQIKKLISGGIKLNVWDMGGQRATRYYWRQYFKEADVVIFVVDAADPRRILEARRELEHLLEEEKVAGVPLLVFANKQDLIGALSVEEITVALNLTDLRDRRWYIKECSAKTGEGLDDGFSWAVKQVKK